jgi:hypothetical protein
MQAGNKTSFYAALMLLVVVSGLVVIWISFTRDQNPSGILVGIVIAAVSVLLRILSVRMKREKED